MVGPHDPRPSHVARIHAVFASIRDALARQPRATCRYEDLYEVRARLGVLEGLPRSAAIERPLVSCARSLLGMLASDRSRRVCFYDGGYDDVTREVLELAERAAALGDLGIVLPVGTSTDGGHGLVLRSPTMASRFAASYDGEAVDRIVLCEGELAFGRAPCRGGVGLHDGAVPKSAFVLRIGDHGLDVALRGSPNVAMRAMGEGELRPGPIAGWTPLATGGIVFAGRLAIEYIGARSLDWALG